MDSSRGIRRWGAEIKSSPIQASAGVALGMMFCTLTLYLEQFRVDKHSVLDQIAAIEARHRILSALLQIALFGLLLRTYKITRKPGEIFIFSFGGGAVFVVLVYALYCGISAAG